MRQKRPWGWFVTLIKRPTWWLKFLYVSGRTSLQYHNDRAEYVFGIRPTKLVFTRIKPWQEHRMENGIYFEVATGKPSEDDIVRIQDDYNRS